MIPAVLALLVALTAAWLHLRRRPRRGYVPMIHLRPLAPLANTEE